MIPDHLELESVPLKAIRNTLVVPQMDSLSYSRPLKETTPEREITNTLPAGQPGITSVYLCLLRESLSPE
jgi:hypothetical protein